MSRTFYREYLSRILEDRCQRNPRYSVRAFARDLGFSAQRLSGVLNGKFGLSPDAAKKVILKLNISEAEARWFRDSVESSHSRSKKIREQATIRLQDTEFKSLDVDQFRLLSDWYHFAIMELTETAKYKASDVPKIARRLGITEIEAKSALERLLKFDLVIEDESDFLKITGTFLANPNGGVSDAIRKHQIQLLKKAENAVLDQTVNEREIRSLTIAITPEQLLEVKTMMAAFQKKLLNKLGENKSQKSEVYVFNSQFFRLTQKEFSND